MNVFAANDLEAADLLALARLDDDGAPPAVTPAVFGHEHYAEHLEDLACAAVPDLMYQEPPARFSAPRTRKKAAHP